MSGPWEKYATTAPASAGPWTKYAAAAPTEGGVQDWEPQAYTDGEKAARVVGLTAQGATDGIAGTVAAPLDISSWLSRNLGLVDKNTPPLSAAFRQAADDVASVPLRIRDAVSQGSTDPLFASRDAYNTRLNPLNTTERTAEGVGQGVGSALSVAIPAGVAARTLQAGTVGQGVASTLATQPALQAIAGGAGGGVTGATGNPWYGLAAGVGVPTGIAAVAKGGQVVNALGQPFSASGRDRIAGNALNSLADDPARAISNMESYRPPVEGFRLSAAKASRDDSLMATENALTRAGAGFGEQANANNAAITRLLGDLQAGGDPRAFVTALGRLDAGAAMRAQAALDALPPSVDPTTAGQAIQTALRGRYDSLVTARSEAANPLYQAARESTAPVPALPLASYVDDLVRANKGEPQAVMERVRGLLFNQDGQLDRTANGMMASRSAINDMLDSQTIGNHTRSLLMSVRSRLDDALAAVPEEQEARRVFAERSVPLRPFDAAQGNKNVASTIERDRFGNSFMLPPEAVTNRFLRPGDAGASTVRELRATGTGDAPVNALEGVVAGRVRDGASVDNLRPAVNALSPRLGGQLDDVQATNALAQGFRSSPAGRFLTGDLDAAVRSTLGAPDSANRMRSLVMSVGDDPQAVAGMRRAILDDFRSVASSKVAEDTAGNPRLTAQGASGWLEKNRAALEGVMTPEQLAGMESIARALKDQSRTATKVAGSDTNRNLATRNIVESLLWRDVGDATVMEPLRKALGLVYGRSNEKIAERLTEALMDPNLAAALMRNSTRPAVSQALSLLSAAPGGAFGAAGANRGGAP